ncbi:MAG: ABC transporter ATP-binding protein [Planctomycetes bacterium]|nr:ABC transporter ATP-binding protein [Planctomycetota bacterium]
MSGIIEVENLSFGYTQAKILKDLSFAVTAGTFIAIAGPNGAGKTTLLNLLCGLLSPETGSIQIDGTGIESYSSRKLAQKVAIVRQEFVPVFDFTVEEMVAMGRTPYLGTFGFESKADKKIVAEALDMTDTTEFAQRPLGELSGGERQRVFIARALAQDTAILLLDEPTSFLDLKHQVGIYDLLKVTQIEKGKTIIVVTHDINLAVQYCDKTLLLGADGNYEYGYAKDILSQEQIERVFDVKTFVGKVGQENYFLPLGKYSKDTETAAGSSNNNQ